MTSELRVSTIAAVGGTSSMTIDSSGRVKMPKVPAFAVRGYGSIQNAATVNGVSIGTGTDVIYNYTSVDLNRDSAFDNSTGIYTVPVAGLYQVQAGFGYKSSANYLGFGLYLTSSDHATNGYIWTWANNDNNHTGRQVSTIVEASVGQEFACAMSDSYSNPSNAVFSIYGFQLIW